MSPDAPGTIGVDGVWKRFRADPTPGSIRQPSTLFKRRGWRWGLRAIDLDIAPGEAVGLVGRNGSGKSTLLKIMTGVMYPYAGDVRVNGRVGALIEVQAGLHPELTGRENVFLYGAFLGLPRRMVAERFDDIIGFAELEAAVDRPIKRYSSGMKMRLGFAVAAFLEPDILLVDEVLAVGDAAFQQRCLDRLRGAIDDGTTLVFVSHDLAAVEAICHRAVWLDDGRTRADGPVHDVLGQYRRAVEDQSLVEVGGGGPVHISAIRAGARDGGPLRTGEPADIELVITSDAAHHGTVHIGVTEGPAAPIFTISREIELEPGRTRVLAAIDGLPLPHGRYALWVAVSGLPGNDDLVSWHPGADIEISGPVLDPPPGGVARLSPVHVAARWKVEGDR